MKNNTSKDKWPLRKVVLVEWLDSATKGGWRNVKDYRDNAKPAACRTVGYLLKDTGDHVTIVQSQGNVDDCTDAMSIPKACITSTKVLRR